MTYPETIEYLYSLRLFGAKFGLSNTLRLAEMVGNPQQRLRFIHVAGTNGKGSTCAMLESIYRKAGLRVGLFTSPHLIAFGERIQVNRQNISDEEIIHQIAELKPLLAQFPPEHHPTFFEVVTIMALRHFAAEKCDLVIWETGLGGRLDATNIVTPLASVITNIQYDHEKWLGTTLQSIAFEKAGIVKPGVPVITGTADPEAQAVIEKTSRANKAPLTVVTDDERNKPPLDSIVLPLLGEHQRVNAFVAAATVQVLQSAMPVSEVALREGLAHVEWPGRMQLILHPSGHRVLLDGAHNVAGVRALEAGLQQYFPNERFTVILGILVDKDWEQICKILAPLAARVLIVPVASERTAPSRDLMLACRSANPAASVSEHSDVRAALKACSNDAFVVVSGSLYLVGEALEILKSGAGPDRNERALNEWQGQAR